MTTKQLAVRSRVGGPDMRDPKLLNLALFLARVRPEVSLFLVPVLGTMSFLPPGMET